MRFYKRFPNGLRLIIKKMEGLYSVSCGVMVKTGSVNENDKNNGISHFIEHCMFKGSEKRSAFEISDSIDRIGAQINAYTSKESTCYYTKSTSEHFKESLEVLSDIFFNSVFDEKELEKEKGVVVEEINMCEDTPEDLCLDLLSESTFGTVGLGQTILGSAKNVKSFTRADLLKYIAERYTPDNVVITIAGNVDIQEAEALVGELFAEKFKPSTLVLAEYKEEKGAGNLFKYKDIEQAHIGISMPSFSVKDERGDALSIANLVFGGGMSSRLFQKIREEMGLCYTVYSYLSQYQNCGVLEIYSGVNNDSRDLSFSAIIEEFEKFKKFGITEQEFLRGKEQMKSSFIMGQESTASQMLLYGRYLLYLDKEFDFKERLEKIDAVTIDSVNDVIKEVFNADKLSVATVGKLKTPLKF